MALPSDYDYALGIGFIGVLLFAGSLFAVSFYQPVLFEGIFIAAGIAVGGSYIGVGGAGVVSRVVNTELLPFVATCIGVFIGFSSVEVVFGQPSGEGIWLFLGLATLNGQVLLGSAISGTKHSIVFIAESVAVFVLAFSYLVANTLPTNLASFLTVSTLTTLLFVVFGWPLFQFGNGVKRRDS
jgi:hypothetical protein